MWNPECALEIERSAMEFSKPGFAFVTLITSDSYLNGALALIKTLRKHSKLEAAIVVLVTPNISASTTKRLSCNRHVTVKVVEPITRPEGSSSENCWANSEYTKLHIWNLMEFTRIVYIDADCIVLENIDELFSLIPDNEQIFAASPDVFPPDKFNAGVLVVTPNPILFNLLQEVSTYLESYDDGDTGLLNGVFYMWYASDSVDLRSLQRSSPRVGPSNNATDRTVEKSHVIRLIKLPFGYNAQRTMHHFTKANPKYWKSINPLKIIHFCSSPKPWETGIGSKLLGELETLWWETFMF